MHNNTNKNNNSASGISWLVIAILFGLELWPIALPLMFLKLFAPDVPLYKRHNVPPLNEIPLDKKPINQSQDQFKEASSKIQKVAKDVFKKPGDSKSSYYGLIALGVLAFFATAFTFISSATPLSISNLLFVIALALAGFTLIITGLSKKNSLKRYVIYSNIIGKNPAMEIEAITKKTGFSKRRVYKDLQEMIEKGYFGETAYINKELDYIFMSIEADKELAAAKVAAEKKAKLLGEKESAVQTANAYSSLLNQIREANQKISDKDMSVKIEKIENITFEIFKAVEKDPSKKHKIDRFISYYLPTTLKLLDHYYELQNTNIEGNNITGSKHSIEGAMDSIVKGFETQLDNLYKNDAFSIDAEIDAMQKIMDNENTSNNSIKTYSNQTHTLSQGSGSIK